jgi:hypothetical protein
VTISRLGPLDWAHLWQIPRRVPSRRPCANYIRPVLIGRKPEQRLIESVLEDVRGALGAPRS